MRWLLNTNLWNIIVEEVLYEKSHSRDDFLIVCNSLEINQAQMLTGKLWSPVIGLHSARAGPVVLWSVTCGFLPTFTKAWKDLLSTRTTGQRARHSLLTSDVPVVTAFYRPTVVYKVSYYSQMCCFSPGSTITFLLDLRDQRCRKAMWSGTSRFIRSLTVIFLLAESTHQPHWTA